MIVSAALVTETIESAILNWPYLHRFIKEDTLKQKDNTITFVEFESGKTFKVTVEQI